MNDAVRSYVCTLAEFVRIDDINEPDVARLLAELDRAWWQLSDSEMAQVERIVSGKEFICV